MVTFWHGLRSESSKKIHILYKFIKKLNDADIYHSKWLTKIKFILDSTGLGYIWNNMGITRFKLKEKVKNRLKDIHFQNWHNEVQENTLYTNYRLFKVNFALENYLIKLSKDLRLVLTKYRTGYHSLPITDRRYDPPDNRNICSLCFTDIGDEFHYVMNCPAFNHIRPKYIHRYFFSRPNTIKFQRLFSSSDITTLTKLSKFLKIIMFVLRK